MKQIITLLILCLTTQFLLAQNDKSQLYNSFQQYDEAVPVEKLYLHTDRTLYKPGEIIWFKAYLTDGANLPSDVSPIVYAKLLSPKGSPIQELKLIKTNGVIHGEFALNANAPGGIYKIQAYTNWMKNQGDNFFFEKDITIQGVVLPKLLMKLDFPRDAYGHGDEVTAELDVRSLDDFPLANKDFDVTLDMDGGRWKGFSGKTNNEGKAEITFTLPETLKSNDMLLNVKFPYEGSIESINRSVPIVLNNVDLQFFAEGGDLIYGTENKVAFKALDEFGKAADVSGVLLDGKGKEITSFTSFHKGMGAFNFFPQKGVDYNIKITKPEGVKATYALPKILDNALGFKVLNQEKDKLYLSVYSPKKQDAYITGYIGGKLQQVFPISLEEGDNKINIPINEMAVGILQMTLFDGMLESHAERLVFVNKHRKINVEISTNKEKYQPREDVTVNIKVKDENGNGVPGDFSLAVVDDQIHTFADDKQDNILSHLLMSSELKGEIEEPKFYFDKEEEKADEAIDYVMMTHGWRRFQWRDVLAYNDKKYNEYVRFEADEMVASGKLLIDGRPVSNARVWVKDHSQFSRTDKNGYFSFKNVSLPLVVETKHRGLKAAATIYQYSAITKKIKASKSNNNTIYANGIYKGKLLDSNGEGLIGASVSIKGTNKGTVSDFDGTYEIAVKPGDVLVVSYVGFQDREIVVGEKDKNLEIALVEKGAEVDLADFNEEIAEVAIEDVEADMDVIVEDDKVFAMADEVEKEVAFKDIGKKEAKKRKAMVEQPMAGVVMMEEAQALDEVVVMAQGVQRRAQVNAAMSVVKAEAIQAMPPAPNSGAAYTFSTTPGFRTPNLYINPNSGSNVRFHASRQFYAPRYNKHSRKQVNGTDKRKTLHWVPNLRTNDKGEASLTYSNADEVSTYRIIMEGISDKGQVIHHEETYYTQKAISMDSKMPIAVTHGDTLMIPVTVKNNTDATLKGNFIAANNRGLIPLDHKGNTNVDIPSGKSHTEFFKVIVDKNHKGKQVAAFHFQSQAGNENKIFNYEINPKGFPRKASFSSKELQRTFTFDINDVMDNSLEGDINIYPNIMEELFSGAASILREPHGCFEQTSSSNYPNVMALQYMKSTGKTDPEKAAMANGYLKRGYARLAGYECSKGGFEWWGNDPAHETLTAYGLVQFVDMKKVFKGVDQAMIDRTAEWLLSRRNGKGGFTQRGNGLDSFRGSSENVGNSYLCYALSEAGYTDIALEVKVATKEALASKDAYQLSLMAITNFNIGNKEKAYECLDAVGDKMNFDGDKLNVTETVTRSYGHNRLTEAASLYATAIMMSDKDKLDKALLEKVIMFVSSKRSGGGFGSTQSTVLALKAMVKYADFMGTTDNSGKVQVYANGQQVYELKYEKGHRGKINVDLKPYLKPGKNTITVAFDETKEALPYSANIGWTSLTPASAPDCRVGLSTSLASNTVNVGETVRLTARIQNRHDDNIPTPIALIGIPAGLSLQPWQLKEMTDKKVFDYYEIQGNYLIAYFTSMDEAETKILNLDLKADIPGSYKAPASTAYLYYDKQDKDWDQGTFVRIKP